MPAHPENKRFFDPISERVNIVSRLNDVFQENADSSAVSANMALDTLRVLDGVVQPKFDRGKQFYQGLGLLVVEHHTAKGSRICDFRLYGADRREMMYDLDVTFTQLCENEPSAVHARRDAYFARLLERTEFSAERSQQVLANIVARPYVLLNPRIARQLVLLEQEA